MIKIIFLMVISCFSLKSFANLPVNFQTKNGEIVNAGEINQNINYINSILSPYGFSQVPIVNSGNVISANTLNSIFSNFLSNPIVFENNKVISSSNLDTNFNNLFVAAKDLVPNSCEQLLQRRPELFNLNNVYCIDLDGFDGPLPPALVYCDMSTDGGGWTNIANNIGSYSNVLSVNGSASTLASMGISTSSTSNQLLNGSLTSISSGNVCTTVYRYLKIKTDVLTKLGANEVKINARSYSSGGASACGGILYDVAFTNLIPISPVGFNIRTLGTCSNDPGLRFLDYTNSQYYNFRYILSSVLNDPPIAVNSINCGAGTGSYQIQSIMVR